MEFSHKSVLAAEIISGLRVKPEGTYVDGTLGAGGHASLICESLTKEGRLIGIDRDIEALEKAEQTLEPYICRKEFINANYADIKRICRDLGIKKIDGAVLDLGVSSYQLDNPERGFSYMNDGPLDMRMDKDGESQESNGSLTAAEIVNTYSEDDIARIIRSNGEERFAKRIAARIVEEREKEPIETTHRLADIVKAAIPAATRREGPHPAKRTFQALRIEVNSELSLLGNAAADFLDMLGSGGRLAVITFHSLEDRIIKEVFAKRENPCECPPGLPECVCGKIGDVTRVTRKPITPTEDELSENPRSRSAKLRIAEKL